MNKGNFGQWLSEGVQAKAREAVKNLAAQWDTLEPKYTNMLPNCEVMKADLFWNLHILDETEKRIEKCAYCFPERWVCGAADDAPKEHQSCRVPLVPIVTRSDKTSHPDSPVGKLEIIYRHCTIYRDWAVEQNARQPKRSKSEGKWIR